MALKKGKFWIEEGIVEDYFYSYVEFNGKKVKCDIPFDIEVEEKCYCIRNADFAYFIIPARMELDDFLKSKLSNTF